MKKSDLIQYCLKALRNNEEISPSKAVELIERAYQQGFIDALNRS